MAKTRVWLTSTIVTEAKIMVAAAMRKFSAAFSMFFETEQIALVRTQWRIPHSLQPFTIGPAFIGTKLRQSSWLFLEFQPTHVIIYLENSARDSDPPASPAY